MDQSCSCIIRGKILPLCEFLKDRLYFVTLPEKCRPRNTYDTHYFNVDDELVYMRFCCDFGPLNLGMLYRYCQKVNAKLKTFAGKKRVVHYTSTDPQKRANAAYLITSYAVIYLKMTPYEAHQPLLVEKHIPLCPFQDIYFEVCPYQLFLRDCLQAIKSAFHFGFVNFQDFDLREYQQFEGPSNGDLNWIVPEKFLAFCGPCDNHSQFKKPSFYFDYFRENNVSTIIRLNAAKYDAKSFTSAGFFHYDLYFSDGGIPPDCILEAFLNICESANGAIAVHCKAGLGRTGTLIGAYLIKHYAMSARVAIAWLRICRPGSVISQQQGWLERMERTLWKAGNIYRKREYSDADRVPFHTFGIYSIKAKHLRREKKNILGPVPVVYYIPRHRWSLGENALQNDPSVIHPISKTAHRKHNQLAQKLTQGDYLNDVKQANERRAHMK